MTISRPNINVRTKQIIFSDAEMEPYVGFEHLKEIPDGWEYNIKKWSSLFDLRLPTLPCLSDPSAQGIKESEFFLSGVGSVENKDLHLNSIRRHSSLIPKNTKHRFTGSLAEDYTKEDQWIPTFKNGWYFRYKTPFFLFSDSSRIQYINASENRDSRNYIKLDKEPSIDSPILAASFKRNPKTKTPEYNVFINHVAQFSGIYVNQEEQETVTETGKINWDNVDFLKKEFLVDSTIEGETSLYFNRNFIETVGVEPTVYQDLAACEILGPSNGTSFQVYYLNKFPVLADSSFHLYIADINTWEEWTRVDSWFGLTSTASSKRYFVDKDLGIVYFGTVSNGGVPGIGKQVVVSYSTTLRIEYEENAKELTVSALNADVNPVTQHINQGFVAITHDKIEAASIVLDIDKPKIPFVSNPYEHGPLYIGTDYGILRATVKTISDVSVQNKLVNFKTTPAGLGSLDGANTSASLTDGLGQAYSSYQPPLTADDLGFYSTIVRTSTHPSYSSGYKEIILREMNLGLEKQEDNLYLYQVLKDDIMLGYESVDEWIDKQVAEGNLTIPNWVGQYPMVMAAESYNRKLWRTMDTGETWEEITPSGFNGPVNPRIRYGDGVWILINNTNVMRSFDHGDTWEDKTSSFLNPLPDRIGGQLIYGNGIFMIIDSGNRNVIVTTNKGDSWEVRGTITGSHTLRDLAYGDGVWIIVGDNCAFRSTDDGVTWSSSPITFYSNGGFSTVNFKNGTFLATISAGDDDVARTTDGGLSWNYNWIAVSGSYGCIDCNKDGDIWMMYRSSAGACTSINDGVTWQTKNFPSGQTAFTGRHVGGFVENTYFVASYQHHILKTTAVADPWIVTSAPSKDWYYLEGGFSVDTASLKKWKDELIVKYDLRDWNGVQSDGSMDGRKVIVYKIDPTGASAHNGDNWDTQAIDPIGNQTTDPPSQQLGAVVPLRPELIEKINDNADEYNGFYRIIYPEAAILDPDPDDADNVLGGYWLVSSRTITCRASCWSDFYNKIIYSNTLTIRLSLPNYMQGEYLTSLLKKVPYGWKLPDSKSNTSSALDGATFITINPHGAYNAASPYNQKLWGPYRIFDVINGTIDSKDEWASAPTHSIGFQWKETNNV